MKKTADVVGEPPRVGTGKTGARAFVASLIARALPYRTEYASEQEAARALLQDVCQKLLEGRVEFAVVGGWVPFLLSSTTELKHPGTYDADILIHEASLSDGAYRASVERLLKEGYLRPAKNEFQAFRSRQRSRRASGISRRLSEPRQPKA